MKRALCRAPSLASSPSSSAHYLSSPYYSPLSTYSHSSPSSSILISKTRTISKLTASSSKCILNNNHKINNNTIVFNYRCYNTASSSSEQPDSSKPNLKYNFQTGIASIPHPSKVKKGGEDASFISSDYRVIAVADGVGGWSDVGVDPALYSRALMEGLKLYCAENIMNISIDPENIPTIYNPVTIMESGYNFANKITGSSTCCVCVIEGLKLRVANLGDSGFAIIRKGKVYFSSQPQQHAFNFPYQLGTESADLPEHAELFEKRLEMGDVVVAATDGLFDNLSADTIASIITKTSETKEFKASVESIKSKNRNMDDMNSNYSKLKTPATILAEKIASYARVQAERRTGDSPFAQAAQNHGYDFKGGKLDDITVVVGIVSEAPSHEECE